MRRTSVATGDKIEIDFSRGGFRAGIKINGDDEHWIRGAELRMAAAEPTELTIHFGLQSLKPQRGYFVSEDDMAAFLAWKMDLVFARRTTAESEVAASADTE